MAVESKTKRGYKKNMCVKCTGLCCRYFALPIETPEDWDDYDDIRWYLTHEDITVFWDFGPLSDRFYARVHLWPVTAATSW